MGNESSNDNRIDFKTKDEKEKINWVKRIREHQAALSVSRGIVSCPLNFHLHHPERGAQWESLSLASSGRGTSSSKVSTSSGERTSRDGDSLLGESGNRHSVQSYGSNEVSPGLTLDSLIDSTQEIELSTSNTNDE